MSLSAANIWGWGGGLEKERRRNSKYMLHTLSTLEWLPTMSLNFVAMDIFSIWKHDVNKPRILIEEVCIVSRCVFDKNWDLSKISLM